MSYRDEVRVSRGTIHRIELRRQGVTFVDVAFYPDAKRVTTNGSLSIHGDFGPFEYFWGATGTPTFAEFLARLDYGYAMGKLFMSRGTRCGAYRDDWSTMGKRMQQEVIDIRKDDRLTLAQARVLYDYFGNKYPLDHFHPASDADFRYAMEVTLFTDMVVKRRRREGEDEMGTPLEWMYDGDTCDMPEPDQERAEPYFWDEVWPVIVDEVRKLEEELNNARAAAAEDCPTDGA